jgi:hypothetical protein
LAKLGDGTNFVIDILLPDTAQNAHDFPREFL